MFDQRNQQIDTQYNAGRDINIHVPPPLDVREKRNRSQMLDKVEAFWIKGMLEQSLYRIARIDHSLEIAPDVVDHPWRSIVQRPNQPNQAVPSGKSIIEIFDNIGSELLILGAPGTGKTTLLLELARDLIARARTNEHYFIPVVFNLSTWSSIGGSLEKWLIDELTKRYYISAKVAQKWIMADAILPLLDGLDEVVLEYREACVKAIDEYRREHGLIPMAVCSRAQEYTELTSKLRLEGAIVIQLLTVQEVDEYLKPKAFAGVRALLHADPTLRELLDTPLMLSVVVLAYKDLPPAKVQSSGTVENRRRQLFDDYIEGMYRRRQEESKYSREQLIRWLSWLAVQMVRHNQSMFYLERMLPDLLPQQQSMFYVRLLAGLLGTMLGGAVGATLGLFVEPVFILVGLTIGLVIGLVIGLRVGQSGGEPNVNWTSIDPIWVLKQEDSKAPTLASLLYLTLLIGLVAAFNRYLHPNAASVGWLLAILFNILLFGLPVMLVLFGFRTLSGLRGVALEKPSTPLQGIQHSGAIALFVAFRTGFIGCVAGVLGGSLLALPLSVIVGTLSNRPDWGVFVLYVAIIVSGIIGTVFSALLYGLRYGGRAVIQHYTLRWLLYRNGHLPFRDLIPFLDHCAEHIFLRKIGGGYIFIHRMLMEHFASLDPQSPDTERQH